MRIPAHNPDSPVRAISYDNDVLTVEFKTGTYRYSGPNRRGGPSLGALFDEAFHKNGKRGFSLAAFVNRFVARKGTFAYERVEGGAK